MKRKIAAILAADIAGYSKLVADDEEDTLRRLGAYRAVFDDFIARHEGRIFNTAGDSVLAEFTSAVEAVRCAIDVQESLRTRNLAYPPSRLMQYRIGISIGDVVEREGDLLGEGVNIAARLEGLADAGGICVSRSVYEQVANKLSVPFADIGEQIVKNIPTPVHAFRVAMPGDKLPGPAIAAGAAKAGPAAPKASRIPILVAVGALAVAAGVSTVALMGRARDSGPSPVASKTADGVPASAGTSTAGAAVPSASVAVEARPALPSVAAPAPVTPVTMAYIPSRTPFLSDQQRRSIEAEYSAATDHKAIAISFVRYGIATGKASDEEARRAAMDVCTAETIKFRKDLPCHVFAVGSTVVDPRGRIPMPQGPWLVRDATVETPFKVEQIPFMPLPRREERFSMYFKGKNPRAVAVSPTGAIGYFFEQASHEEAMRRSLETCGWRGGVPCRIIAIDDMFILPMPQSMRVAAFFLPRRANMIIETEREGIAQKLANNQGGWSAVAVGSAGKSGIAVKAASEQAAIDGAISECGKGDTNCRVIAIGPWAVEPK